MSSPVIDVSSVVTASGVSSVAFNVTTSQNNEVLALVICNAVVGGTAKDVTGITGATFTKLGSTLTETMPTQFQGNENLKVEVWTAPIPTAGGLTITVTFAASCTGINIVYAAVEGTYSGSAFFDSNPGFPYSAFSGSVVPVLTFNTTEANDLLWHHVISGRLGTYGTGPAGWSGAPGGLENVTNCTIQNISYQKSVSSVQAGAVTGVPSSAPFPALSLLLGFTADAAPAGSQTYVSVNGS